MLNPALLVITRFFGMILDDRCASKLAAPASWRHQQAGAWIGSLGAC